MSINFPSKPDVPLANPPLVEVISQVRFPPILRINKEEPSEFQEEIREIFPKFELEQGILFRIPGPSGEGEPSAETKGKIYRFRTFDEQTTVSLTVDFYALSTNRYTHWTDFARNLSLVDRAVRNVYRPAYTTRIGLRFINRITPENTGLETIQEIFALLNPELTGYVQNEVWSDPVEFQSRLKLSDDEAQLTLRTGHGSDKSGQPYFMLDFDYFEEDELPLSDLVDRFNRYHDVIYRAFRWCLPDESLTVFKPIPKET
ncbi:MAG: TIGR04255 family protein [Anaerolineales bacterium]